METFIRQFWKDVAEQDEKQLKQYFHPKARIQWLTSNEDFSVQEYIRANCEYPGHWEGCVTKIIEIDDMIITVTKVTDMDSQNAFYATSFFTIENGKILFLEECWGDIGSAPQWRQKLKLGRSIQ